MANQTVKSGDYQDKRYKEVFVESVADLANLPQAPNSHFGLGSVAYDKDFNIWVLTMNGWEASA
jgi:hypothetical protein